MEVLQRLEIIAQPAAQVFCFPHIDDPAISIPPLVNSRLHRDIRSLGAEKVTAVPKKRGAVGVSPRGSTASLSKVAHVPWCLSLMLCTQHIFKVLPCPAVFILGNVLGGTLRNNSTAAIPSFRSQINDPVCAFDDI